MTSAGKAIPYKQAHIADAWDAIVIGSGIGGLAAAAALSLHAGKRVLVLERHYVAGGFTHSFHRPGFDWDVGLHYIGQVHDSRSPVRRAFDHLTAGAVKWSPMPQVYDRILIRDRAFNFTAGADRLHDSLLQSFPAEGRAINGYIRAVRAAERFAGLYYAEKVMPAPIAAIAGGLLRAPYLRWARRSTLQVLQGLTGNRELIGVFAAQWGDYGLPPAQSSFAIHATIAAHYLAGASYPVGGASTIAAAIIPQIERAGGTVITSAEVSRILLAGNRAIGVSMADGRQFHAPLIFSDAGAGNTFNRLLPASTPAVQPLRQALRALPTSSAHLCLYVGLDAAAEHLGLNGANLWVYPGFDHDENVRRFAAGHDAPFPAVYISFPSAKDPDFARRHPGKSTIEVIAPIPYDAFARWGTARWGHRGAGYDQLKQQFAARLQSELLRQVPQAAGHIQHAELSTPVTTRHFMNYQNGEIYGIAATPARYALRQLGARTPIAGLFLAGQDAAILGVVGALYGGVVGASAALGRNLVASVHKPLPQ